MTNIFDMIFSESAIQEALVDLEQKKDSCGVDGMYLSELRTYWEINRSAIIAQLKLGCYEPDMVRIKEILSRDGKRRRISVFCSLDRLLLRCLERYLQKVYDPTLHSKCFAYRPDMGVAAAVNQVVEYLREGYRWGARIDVHDFFGSIPLQPLEQCLSSGLEIKIVRLIIRYLHLRLISDTGELQSITKGILQGSPISPILSNIYLTPLDESMGDLPACRFADDILVCFRTRSEAEAYYPELVNLLGSKYQLEVNQRKSGVLEIAKQQFLGYSFHIDEEQNIVSAFRAKRARNEFDRDWRQGHVEKIDRHYHIINNGIISKRDYNLLFENEEGKHYIPVETMGSLNIYSDVLFSSNFFRFASEKHLYISIFDHHGNMTGSFTPADNGYRSKTMLRQAAIYLDPGKRLKIAKLIELGAFHNLRANIRYYAKSRKSETLRDGVLLLSHVIEEMDAASSIEELLLLEARGRSVYYTMFNAIMDNRDFAFTVRTRRPPKDALNALISFGNTYLYNRVATEINKTAMDIRIGFLHSTNKRSQSLNLDIAELFKPLIVDRAIFTLVNKRRISPDEHFRMTDNGGVYLSNEGRRLYINELDGKMYQKRVEDHRPISYDTRVREEVQKVLRFVNSGKEYKPYKYY